VIVEITNGVVGVMGIGLLVMTVLMAIGGALFYMACGPLKPGKAYLFAISATALLSLPVLVAGQWSLWIGGGGLVALVLWLLFADHSRGDGDEPEH
jgi:hypothetical protein